MTDRIALIDYGAGNLRSVHNALRAAGADNVEVTGDAGAVATAERIVLPGVGAFAACMTALSRIPGMVDALNRRVVEDARPFLGICVGMQLMAAQGEEHGRHGGLGWIDGTVRRLEPSDAALKVPHMGWNDVTLAPQPRAAIAGLIADGEAYFLHSYQFDTVNPADILATTDHGGAVTAAVGRDTMLGVQFHPEKSQDYGLAFLARFLAWKP